jgi:cytosine deaminase
VAFLAAHLLWMTTGREIETLYDMVTTHAAQAMNVKEHLLQVGNPANLVVLETSNVLEALREHAAPKHVIMNGNIIDPVKMKAVARSGKWNP